MMRHSRGPIKTIPARCCSCGVLSVPARWAGAAVSYLPGGCPTYIFQNRCNFLIFITDRFRRGCGSFLTAPQQGRRPRDLAVFSRADLPKLTVTGVRSAFRVRKSRTGNKGRRRGYREKKVHRG